MADPVLALPSLVRSGKRPKATSLSHEIFRDIRDDIVMCRLWPGSKLQPDRLAARFDVSLSSVREALSRLSAEGLVISEPQRGFWVAPVAIDELRDITKARIEVESTCVRWSVDNGDDRWETALREAYDRTREIPPFDPVTNKVTDEWEVCHDAFHEALVANCDCQTLKQIRRQLFEKAERYRRLAGHMVQNERDIADEHRMIMQAALKRDSALAAALLASHIRETADNLISREGELLSPTTEIVGARTRR